METLRRKLKLNRVRKTMKVNYEKLEARLENSDRQLETSTREQQRFLTELSAQFGEGIKQIQSVNSVTSKIAERFEWLQNLSQEIRRCVQNTFMVTRAIYLIAIDIRSRLPTQSERSMYSEIIILEDSIGRTFPIPIQTINSWDAFDALVEVQFRNRQGYHMIQRQEYVLHESLANRDLERRFPWEAEVSPGQRIVMCMLFTDLSELDCCPSCFHMPDFVDKSADVKW